MTILAICLVVVGVGVTSTGALRLVRSNAGTRTQGEILGVSQAASFLDPYKDASYRYTAVDGTEQTVWSSSGTGTGPAVGRPVQVVYDPADPKSARLATPFVHFLWFFVVGDALLLIGVLLLVL
jgi:hypothetical protein